MSEPEQRMLDPSASAVPRGVLGMLILLLCAVLPFLMLAISYEVVARYLFSATTLWINDVTGYLMLALTFLGGAFVMARDGHTRVDILVVHAGTRLRAFVAVFNNLVIIAVSIVMAGASGYVVWDAWQRNVQTTGIVDVPRWVIISPIFIGFLLLCIERGRWLWRHLRARRAPATGPV